jgi:hypothetical protein
MENVRWVVASLLGFLGGWIILGNWIISAKRGGGSLVPLMGGLILALALVVVPVAKLNSLWWSPLLGDLGCVPLLFLAGAGFLWSKISKNGGAPPPPPDDKPG